APTFSEALRWGCEVFHNLKKILKAKGLATGVGDEGGFAPRFENNDAVFDVLLEAIQKAGRKPGDEVALALDVAASEFGKDGRYRGKSFAKAKPEMTAAELSQRYEDWCAKYPIVSIEDGFGEDDWDAWGSFTKRMGARVQL